MAMLVMPRQRDCRHVVSGYGPGDRSLRIGLRENGFESHAGEVAAESERGLLAAEHRVAAQFADELGLVAGHLVEQPASGEVIERLDEIEFTSQA
jgi:hypothetical protein